METILLTGASGMVGRHLQHALAQSQYRVYTLTRAPKSFGEPLYWKPEESIPPRLSAIEPIDAVIHLAGSPIATHRWSTSRKKELFKSRINATKLLIKGLKDCETLPRVFLSASASGYYGECGDAWVGHRVSPPGQGFLSDMARQWEDASASLSALGTRVIYLRFGDILSTHGGILPRIVPLIRAGVGAHLGRAQNFMSWIDLEDAGKMILHALSSQTIHGPIDVVSPYPVRSLEFMSQVAHNLNKKIRLSIPKSVLYLMYGEMAPALLCRSVRVQQDIHLKENFSFTYPKLDKSLDHILKPYKT